MGVIHFHDDTLNNSNTAGSSIILAWMQFFPSFADQVSSLDSGKPIIRPSRREETSLTRFRHQLHELISTMRSFGVRDDALPNESLSILGRSRNAKQTPTISVGKMSHLNHSSRWLFSKRSDVRPLKTHLSRIAMQNSGRDPLMLDRD